MSGMHAAQPSGLPLSDRSFDPIVDGGCDGSSGCRAVVHIHGCFADNGENCDNRYEHTRDAEYHRFEDGHE